MGKTYDQIKFRVVSLQLNVKLPARGVPLPDESPLRKQYRRAKFESLRKEIKADIRKQHDLYVNNLVKANPRDFYRYINSQKKDTQGIPPLKKRNGSGIAQSEFEKAEEFNGQFSDVFTKSEYKQVPLMDRSAPFMHDIVVTKEGVTKLLKGLNPSKALLSFIPES